MWLKVFMAVLLIGLSSVTLYAQEYLGGWGESELDINPNLDPPEPDPDPDWFYKTGDSPAGANLIQDITVDYAGNVIATGHFSSSSPTDWAIQTVKLNSNGGLLWSREYNPGYIGLHDAHSVITDASGNVYVCATPRVAATAETVLTVLKYSSSGNIQWVYEYNGTSFSYGQKIVLADDGYLYAAGGAYTGSATKEDYLVVKLNPSNGSEVATVTWDSPNHNINYPTDIEVNQNYVYVTGATCNNNTDVHTVQFDLNLNLINSDSRDKSYYDLYPLLDVSNSGDVYLIYQWIESFGPVNRDAELIKFNSSLSEQWTMNFTGDMGVAMPYGIEVDSQGRIDVAVCTYNGSSFEDIYVAQINPGGSLIWDDTWNDGAYFNERPIEMILDASDNILVAGYHNWYGINYIQTIVYSYNGSELEEYEYNYASTGTGDVGRCIATNNLGHLFVGAIAYNSANTFEWGIMRYPYTYVGIAEENISEIVAPVITCFPQPFSESVRISLNGLSTDVHSISGIDIYDLSGNLIHTIDASLSQLTGDGILWESGDYSPGVYYSVVKAGSETYSQRMIKI